MQRCQLTQCEQSALRRGVEHTRRGKADSAMDDSMSDRPHVADGILLEKGIEHCVEGNRLLLIGQLLMRAGNTSRVLRGGVRGW
jgi:hypothetical protein